METASAGGDAALMVRAADAIAAEFDVDPLVAKAAMLDKFGQGAPTESRIKSFVEAVEPVIDEAVAADRPDVALKLASTAHQACQGPAGREYRKAMYDLRNEIQQLHRQWQVIERARTDVASDPRDAAAQLVLGRHLCFAKNDWTAGLPHLVQCSDEALKSLAKRDVDSPETADAQAALADAWWDHADRQDESDDKTAAASCRTHAAGWYRRALPELSGLAKIKAEQRLKEAAATAPLVPAPPAPVVAVSAELYLRQFLEAVARAKPVNLGPAVNSSGGDGHPALSADGCTLLFVSPRSPGLGHDDLWMCQRGSRDEPFGMPENLGPSVNSSTLDRGPALSADGRLLLFCSSRPGGLGKLDLWMCARSAASKPFGAPVNFGPQINTSADDCAPTLSADGLTLIFASDRPGGVGSQDLWACVRRSPEARFGPPVNLGPPVNSAAKDASPTLSADDSLLLFSSDRPGGSGSDDLWVSARSLSDSRFGPPVNLGPTINSSSVDREPVLSSDGRLLLFDSNRGGGFGEYDLWMMELEPDVGLSPPARAEEPTGREPPTSSSGGASPDERLRKLLEAVARAKPVNLGRPVNSGEWDDDPALSPDGCTLLFSSWRRGGFVGPDLWMCTRASLNEPFGSPVDLGPSVNASQRDLGPALSSDGRLLLFCSKRPGGLGKADLWMIQLDPPLDMSEKE
jgi:Tol biopolymer transport system component